MPLNPGNDTITFINPAIVNDRLHRVTAVGQSSFIQVGCALQPISVKDRLSDTEYAEATDKCLVPANANTEAIVAEWRLTYTPPGATTTTGYRIVGAKRYRDDWGRTNHITFLCKEETG